MRWQVRKSKDRAQLARVKQHRKAQRAEALRQEAAELASKGRWRQDRDNEMAEAKIPPEKRRGKARRTAEASEESDGDSPFDCHY